MKRQLGFSILALLAATATAPSGAAQARQASTSTSILFTRATFDPRTGDVLQSSLYRLDRPSNLVVPLAPASASNDVSWQARWSPAGSSVVYSHSSGRYPQLYVVDRQGGTTRRITTGLTPHMQPVWGPQGGIAFITERSADPDFDEGCLSIVKADGTGQHDLFCPPYVGYLRTQLSSSTPQWSADGKSIYLEVGALQAGLEPTYGDSRIYLVNAATGAVSKITEQQFDDTTVVSIAPDGQHAVYALIGQNAPLTVVDLATGARSTLAANGADVRYSKDGHLIAFVYRTSIINTASYGRVYVMNADGSNVHAAISHPDPNATYAIGDWSADSSRLLVNEAVNDQVNDQVVQSVNLSTGTATTLTQGIVGEGAWFKP